MSEPPADPPTTLSSHVLRTLKLAIPVTVARTGLLAMATADIVMTGRAGAAELAFFGLANAPHVTLMLACVGLLQGATILTAQAYGAEDFRECGAYWRLGLLHALGLGLIIGLLMLLAEPFFRLTGQSELLAHGAAGVMHAFAWGMPGFLLFAATSFFLEAMHRPTPGMIVMLIANGANIGLNWVLIYGHLGFPAMGAEGAAAATSAVRWLMFALIGAYVLTMPGHRGLGIRGAIAEARTKARKLRRLGYPIGITYGLESAAITALVIMAGTLGVVPTAGYQIAHNLMALAYMATLGLATAASVRVGNAVGRGDRPGVSRAGWIACAMGVVAMAAIAVPYTAAAEPLARLYTPDPAVVRLAAPLIGIIAVALVFDTIQGVLIGAARGAASVWIPTVIHLGSYWGVAVPLGYGLSFALGLGAKGLLWGLVGGFFVASVALALHFNAVARRPLARY